MSNPNLFNFTVNATSVHNDQSDDSSEMCGVWHVACVTGIVVLGVAVLGTLATMLVARAILHSTECPALGVSSDREQGTETAVAVPITHDNSTVAEVEAVTITNEMSAIIVPEQAEIITVTQPIAEAVAVGEVVPAIV